MANPSHVPIEETIHLNVDAVKEYLNIKGKAQDTQINMLINSTVAYISKEIGEALDVWLIPFDLGFVISKYIEFFMNPVGVDSYSLSRESTTYSDTLPFYLVALLDPYKKTDAATNQVKVRNFR